MPDDDKEPLSPRGWTLQQVIEWSKTTAFPLNENSSPEEILKARGKAVGESMSAAKARKAEAMLRVKERVKMHYEMGTDIGVITKSYQVKRRDVEKWAVTEKWSRPEDMDPINDSAALEVDANFGIVTMESEEKMPAHVRQMKEQKRLMGLRGKQWENVPFDMIPQALRMRLTGQVRRAIEIYERMDDDDLMQDIKGLKTVAEVLEKVAPIPEESGAKKMLLHMSIFNAEEGLPPKAAKVIDVAPDESKQQTA